MCQKIRKILTASAENAAHVHLFIIYQTCVAWLIKNIKMWHLKCAIKLLKQQDWSLTDSTQTAPSCICTTQFLNYVNMSTFEIGLYNQHMKWVLPETSLLDLSSAWPKVQVNIWRLRFCFSYSKAHAAALSISFSASIFSCFYTCFIQQLHSLFLCCGWKWSLQAKAFDI